MSKAKTDAAPKSDLMALVERAQRGDETVLPALREHFRRPDMVELTGNLARQA